MSHANHQRRRGMVLVAALVCLVVVMALLGHMLVGALRTGRQMHRERDRRQCDFPIAALDAESYSLAERFESGHTLRAGGRCSDCSAGHSTWMFPHAAAAAFQSAGRSGDGFW